MRSLVGHQRFRTVERGTPLQLRIRSTVRVGILEREEPAERGEIIMQHENVIESFLTCPDFNEVKLQNLEVICCDSVNIWPVWSRQAVSSQSRYVMHVAANKSCHVSRQGAP